MRETVEFWIWKQRREEMLQEVEQNRLARALRGSRKRRGARWGPLLVRRPKKARAADARVSP